MTKHRADRAEMIRGFIVDFTADRGYAPSVREIMAGVGLSTPSAVQHHLIALRKAGLIADPQARARGNLAPAPRPTAKDIQLAWCLSSHGMRPPKVRPCQRHKLMSEWIAEIVLPRAEEIALARLRTCANPIDSGIAEPLESLAAA